MRVYYARIFDNKKKPVMQPNERYHSSTRTEATQLLYVETPDDNIWEHNREFEIFANKDGIGYREEIPGGYSEYTYDPEVVENFYVDATWEWFKAHVLDQDQRELISVNDEEEIKNGLTEEQKRQ